MGRFQKFLLIVLLTGLAGIVAVNLLWDLQLTQNTFFRQTVSRLSLELERRALRLENVLRDYTSLAQNIAEDTGKRLLWRGDSEQKNSKTDSLLAGYVQKYHMIKRLQIVNKTGDVLSDSYDRTGKEADVPFRRISTDDGPFISEVRYSSLNNVFYFQMVLPIKRSVDEVLGFIVVEYDMGADIFPLLKEAEMLGSEGEFYLIDRQGLVMSPLRFRKDSVLNQRVNMPLRLFDPENDGERNIYPNYLGRRVIGLTKYLPAFNWYIVGEIQIRQVYDEARDSFLWIFAVHFIFLLLLLIIVYVFINNALKPLRSLQAGLRKILQGNYDYRFDRIPKNELGEIAAGLNCLMDKVQEMLGKTEERILQSTNELQVRLKQYEEQNILLNDIRRASLNLMEDLEDERHKIESSEEKIRTIIASAMDAIIVVGTNGMIDTFNPAAERMFGYKAKEMIGSPISKLWPENDQEGNSLIQNVLNQYSSEPNYVQSKEMIAQTKDGKIVPLEISIGTMNIAHRSWAVVILRDVTERKNFEEELLRQKRNLEKVNLELDSFVYMASHDLRAPLRGISAFASFLETDCAGQLDDKGKDYIKEIKKGAYRLGELIDDLLNLSRMSRMRNPYEDVEIKALVEQVRKRMEFDMRQHNVELIVQENIPLIHCDRIKMAEVFLNLIGNAVKFSSKIPNQHPRVEIGYIDRGNEHELYVKDNGIGIDPKYHQKIFGIFKRLHTMEEYDGTGAGLSIVERIVLDHGGRIWVESELGKGAIFFFSIPKRPLEYIRKE